MFQATPGTQKMTKVIGQAKIKLQKQKSLRIPPQAPSHPPVPKKEVILVTVSFTFYKY